MSGSHVSDQMTNPAATALTPMISRRTEPVVHRHLRLSRICLSFLVGMMGVASLVAQPGTPPAGQTAPSSATPTGAPAATAKPGDEKTIELSPFEVRPDEDTGYQAMNTTSGSRLATSLK